MDEQQKLKARLHRIWEPPNFSTFFKTFSKRPAHKMKKGTILFNEGDPLNRIYFIQEGYVKLYRLSEEGRETTIYLYGPGYVLGIRALTSKDTSARHNAETLTDTKILTLSHEEYFDAIQTHPELLIDLVHIFIDRLNYTERKLEGFIVTDTTARIANFLSDCVHRFCKKPKDPIVLPFELTHQRIAEFVGTTRETVTVSLHKLEKDGVLSLNKGKITIHNLKKLKRFSQTNNPH